jgi:hypothetical protein
MDEVHTKPHMLPQGRWAVFFGFGAKIFLK